MSLTLNKSLKKENIDFIVKASWYYICMSLLKKNHSDTWECIVYTFSDKLRGPDIENKVRATTTITALLQVN